MRKCQIKNREAKNRPKRRKLAGNGTRIRKGVGVRVGRGSQTGVTVNTHHPVVYSKKHNTYTPAYKTPHH